MESINVMYRKRKKITGRKLKTSLFVWLSAATVVIGLIFHVVNKRVYPSLETLAKAKAEKLAIEAMTDAIRSTMATKSARDLLNATENGEKVYMLSADSMAMNDLSCEFSDAAQKRLSEISDMEISLSLGTLTGVALFSGLGPNINVRFTPACNVRSEFVSTLENSGINQTLYRVNVVLCADIYVILPGKSSEVTVKTDAAIAESVIVGDVPQVYTNVDNKEDMLNLVPTELP